MLRFLRSPLFALAGLVPAAAQMYYQAPAIGLDALGYSHASANLNASTTRVAVSIMLVSTKTLNSVRFYVPIVTGTVGAGDICVDLRGDSSTGTVDASIEEQCNGGSVSSGSWVDITGFTSSLTAGTRYWLIWRNADANPATNYPNVTYAAGTTSRLISNNNTWGMARGTSADSGSSYSYGNSRGFAGRLGFSDSSYVGTPVSEYSGCTTENINGTKEVGARFTTPAGGSLRAIGIACELTGRTGSPGALSYKLYTGETLQAATNSIPAGLIPGNSQWAQFFTSVQTIPPNTDIRIVASAASGGTSDYWRVNILNWDSDANSSSLRPVGSTFKLTAYSGASWSDHATYVPICALLLDPSQPTSASGGGGGGAFVFVQ